MEDYIRDYHINHVITNYLPKCKVAFALIIVLMVVINCAISEKVNENAIVSIVILRINIFIWILFGAIILIHYFPRHYEYIAPIVIAYGAEWAGTFSIENKIYPLSECSLPWVILCFMTSVIVPSQAKNNWITFSLGLLYYLYQLHVKRDMLNILFVISMMVVNIYYYITSYILYTNLKHLYKNIYQNHKQAIETKRLLDVFPHAVIIQSKKDHVEFTNQEFKHQISDIQNSADELLKIDTQLNELEGKET